MLSSSFRQVKNKVDQRIDAFVPGGQVQLFVGGMQVVIRQAKTGQDRFDADRFSACPRPPERCRPSRL